MPGQIIYGAGVFAEVGNIAIGLGKKALIISDPIMEQIGVVAECQRYLEAVSLVFATFTGVPSEPTDAYVNEALELCRKEQCDLIITVGGGSCIDTAKAVAVMMTNTGYIGDYRGANPFKQAPLPLIAIPTTAGTGSEVTKVTVIIDTVNDVKMMISQPELLPRVAIVDPLLTLSCPPHVTAATGLDALCHAVEAYLSRKAHPLTDTLALGAITRIMSHLPTAYEQGADLIAREQMAIGSMMAGAAFSNASVTLVHGMSRPIGALFHVPHGISNAMLLAAVLEFTRPAAERKLAEIGRMIWPHLTGDSDERLADAFISEIKRLCKQLNIPNLRGWGIDEQRFTKLLPKMAADAILSGSPGNNQRVPTEQELTQLYQLCFDYKL
ncbi:iron-containing alcohol dehydrogenase [Paenibacillus agricola]|uniref:Iron-containing alcohol dehydrogenase n=1 Tax=Paenibacillus agricola TaxID=2716264 RepID=A0ABX0IZ98_9BACL|nr:iron-containing alcohol dehydrogenase [Paenibacillus agricola]NHN29033.1 iron-containing alcohol dehydrogenase [Paenibacillus agricola]